jgi:hypothetical protein
MVIGFDHVTGMGKPVKIRAATAPRDNAVQQWGGRELFFQEIAPPLAKADKPTASRTDERGLAELPWTLKHATPVAEIEAVYIDEAMRPPWTDRARSRVFSWPTASRVLLLDVEPTLKNAANWAELAKALRNAEANGWHIVYLALKEDAPLEYKKVRNWVLTQTTASEHALVNGPVLGRLHLAAGESEPTARKAVLATLKAEFTGAIVFVSGEQGLQLRNIATAGDWAGEPVSLAGWQELPDKLAK